MSAGTLTPERAKKAQLLASLAWLDIEGVTVLPGGMVRACVRVGSAITDGTERLAAWREYRAAVEAELDIEEGRIDWRDIDDTLTCPERTDVAREIARQRSEDALAVLLVGPPQASRIPTTLRSVSWPN